MTKGTMAVAIICVGIFLMPRTFMPSAMALKTPSRDQYMVEQQRPPKANDYLLEGDGEMGAENDIYTNERLVPARSSKELLAFIVAYVNMIRNYQNLLDQSATARTHKRGNDLKTISNIKTNEQVCGCAYTTETLDLGENTFPRIIEYRNCSRGTCKEPFICKENLYNMTILKLRNRGSPFDIDLHNELKYKWYAVNTTISVGCLCSLEPYTSI